MQECQRLLIPFGVYLYSYALREEQVKSEVQHTLRMIQGFNPTLGVWFDMEDADGYKARNGINVYESRQLLTDFCKIYCNEMKALGFKTGIYANMNYFKSVLHLDQLSEFDKWLAVWGPTECPEGDWLMWQYSSDGVVNGSNARTDMNCYYGEIQPIEPIIKEVAQVVIEEEISAPQQTEAYSPGESVVVLNAEQYSGGSFATYYDSYQIIECKGDRAVIGIDGQITAAINIANIIRVGEPRAFTEPEPLQQNIVQGSTVRVVNAEQYSGGKFNVYYGTYELMELNGDRAVIGINGQVTTAINICNLELA